MLTEEQKGILRNILFTLTGAGTLFLVLNITAYGTGLPNCIGAIIGIVCFMFIISYVKQLPVFFIDKIIISFIFIVPSVLVFLIYLPGFLKFYGLLN